MIYDYIFPTQLFSAWWHECLATAGVCRLSGLECGPTVFIHSTAPVVSRLHTFKTENITSSKSREQDEDDQNITLDTQNQSSCDQTAGYAFKWEGGDPKPNVTVFTNPQIKPQSGALVTLTPVCSNAIKQLLLASKSLTIYMKTIKAIPAQE